MTGVRIHDGRELRPLNPVADLGHRVEEFTTDGGLLLYIAERDLFTRAEGRLVVPPPRRAGTELDLGREDVAVLAYALESLGRIRARNLTRLADPQALFKGLER